MGMSAMAQPQGIRTATSGPMMAQPQYRQPMTAHYGDGGMGRPQYMAQPQMQPIDYQSRAGRMRNAARHVQAGLSPVQSIAAMLR